MPPEDTHPTAPLIVVHFGEPAWQAHLGGDFHAPEESGGMSWIWMGGGKCWVILPDTNPPGVLGNTDLQVRLEAALHWPLAPGDAIMDIAAVDDSGAIIMQGVATRPEDDALWRTLPLEIPFRGTATAAAGARGMTLRAGRRPPPTLDIRSESQTIATISFERSQLIQTREFVLPRGALGPSRALYFHPSSAIAPVDFAIGHSDTRRLSYRLFRMQVRAAPIAEATAT